MDNLEFDREPPATRLTTLVMAFGGWIDAGRAATGATTEVRHLNDLFLLQNSTWLLAALVAGEDKLGVTPGRLQTGQGVH